MKLESLTTINRKDHLIVYVSCGLYMFQHIEQQGWTELEHFTLMVVDEVRSQRLIHSLQRCKI
jgi:hypothetical protein